MANLVQNLETRFMETVDQGIISILFTIFNPKSYPTAQQEIYCYGHSDIDRLEEFFCDGLPNYAMCSTEF